MLDRLTKVVPTAREVIMFEALSAVAYEFHAEPIAQLTISASALELIRTALREFSLSYPDWYATRNTPSVEDKPVVLT